jgi:hypothetical protein
LFISAGVDQMAKAAAVTDKGAFAFDSCNEARFKFNGVLGARIDANTEHWLLRAPQANPGMLEMFRVRDRQPVPNLVPWAGEFVGKYLISAIQALRMSVAILCAARPIQLEEDLPFAKSLAG